MSTVLVIEDDTNIRTGVLDILKMEGYETLCAADGRSGLKMAEECRPDLVILDIMLPGIDGFEVCRQLRAKSVNVPIIILSVRGEESDRVLGLELGADDYVSKPFSVQELLMRVRAVLRRTASPEPQVVKFSNMVFDFTKYEFAKDGKPVKLTASEFTILKLLVHNVGEPVSRHKILSVVWGENVTSRTIDTHIWNLREKLEDDPSRPKHILTIHRIGYKFVG